MVMTLLQNCEKCSFSLLDVHTSHPGPSSNTHCLAHFSSRDSRLGEIWIRSSVGKTGSLTRFCHSSMKDRGSPKEPLLMVPLSDTHMTAYGSCSLCRILTLSKTRREKCHWAGHSRGKCSHEKIELCTLCCRCRQSPKRREVAGKCKAFGGQFGAKGYLRYRYHILISLLNFTSI